MKKRSAHEQNCCYLYFFSYCPLFISTLYFCSGHNFQIIKAINSELYTLREPLWRSAVKNHNSATLLLRVLPSVYFHFEFLSWP